MIQIQLRRRILVPLGVALVIILGCAFFSNWYRESRQIRHDTQRRIASVEHLFEDVLQSESQLLNGMLELLTRNASLRAAWTSRDREELLNQSLPLFEDLRRKFRVTHFYYTDLVGVCFLRVHHPQRHGDRIPRFTQNTAMQTKVPASGIELGTFGTFTLRAVYPWKVGSEIIGYIELGMEIEHLTPHLVETAGAEVAFMIDKVMLDRSAWEYGRKMMGLEANWDALPKFVIVDQTFDAPTGVLADVAARTSSQANTQQVRIQVGSARFMAGSAPLRDAGGREVGRLVVLQDIRAQEVLLGLLALQLLAVWVLVAAPLFLLFSGILQKAEKRIDDLTSEITDLARRESEERYDSLAENLRVGVSLISPDMLVLRLNRQMKEWFPRVDEGTSPLCYHSFPQPPREAPCEYCPAQQTFADGHSHESITEMPIGTEMRSFRIVSSPVHDTKGMTVAALEMVEDITEVLRTEEGLREAKELAETANATKSEFLANMSHELRTPLNGIMGLTDLVLDTELTEEQRENLSIVQSAAEVLLGQINSVLDLSKVEAGKIELESAPFSLSEAVNEAMRPVSVTAEHKGLTFSVRIPTSISDMVIGDAIRLQQVLVNLTANAIKFTNEGEVTIEIAEMLRSDSHVRFQIAVSDTGVGIPEDRQEQIFEPFSQADSSTTRKYGGTGLGLTICQRLVELMGGSLWAESEVGDGSTFYFTVDLGLRLETPVLKPRPLPMSTLRVLLFDPNASRRFRLTSMLRKWEIYAEHAFGREDLIRTLKDAQTGRPFDVLLVHCDPDAMDDIQAMLGAAQGDQLAGSTLVLLLLGNGERRKCGQALGSGISGCLTEPLNEAALLKRIRNGLLKWRGVEVVEDEHAAA